MPPTAIVWRTCAAAVLALATWFVVSTVLGTAIFYLNRLTTVTRPEIIGFFAHCVAGGAGVVAAKAACDKLLNGYAPRAIFVVFAAFSLFWLVNVWFLGSEPPAPFTFSFQMIVVLFVSWFIFWQGYETF